MELVHCKPFVKTGNSRVEFCAEGLEDFLPVLVKRKAATG